MTLAPDLIYQNDIMLNSAGAHIISRPVELGYVLTLIIGASGHYTLGTWSPHVVTPRLVTRVPYTFVYSDLLI